MKGSNCTRLSAVALGVAFGVTTALTMILFAWAAMGGYGTQIVEQWATIYPGFAASMKGGFIGGVWGFVEGFLFGLIAGWIYNLCLCCCSKGRCCCGKASCSTCGEK